MKPQEIILEMEKLPPEERQEVFEYFVPELEECFTREIVDELIDRKKEAEQGINMSEGFQGDDITLPLKKLLQPE